jgi:hypothetical protein
MAYELLQTIRQCDPDILFLIGRHRGEFPALPANLCVLGWDQDYALCCLPAYAKHLGPRDLLLLEVADWRNDAMANGIPEQRTIHLNVGANHRIYRPPATPQAPEYDVLFVGSFHHFHAYRRHVHFDLLEPAVQRLMLHARGRLAWWISTRDEGEPFILPDLDQFLRQSIRELGPGYAVHPDCWRRVVNYFRYRVAHLLVRQMYVSSLTEFRLGLFGRGWDQLPATARHARGEIRNGAPLRGAIHRAAINLHIHAWSVHHPRLYDTAAAGGFLLVGRVQEEHLLERSFDVGCELDSFGSIPELKRKVRHYLDHAADRRAMAERAAERVRRQHTMEQRMVDLIGFLSKDLHG